VRGQAQLDQAGVADLVLVQLGLHPSGPAAGHHRPDRGRAAIFAQIGGLEGHLQPEIWKLVEW
jgi:hypothetical protein